MSNIRQKLTVVLAVVVCNLFALTAMAQYPNVPDSVKKATEEMMTEFRKKSDQAWWKAYPIVQEEAKHGRPYIPWANRPYDFSLSQHPPVRF